MPLTRRASVGPRSSPSSLKCTLRRVMRLLGRRRRTLSGTIPAWDPRPLKATGITYLNCVFAIGRLEHAEVLKSMERFARDVMPQFKDKVGLTGAVEAKA